MSAIQYEGKTYRAPSGQWAFVITIDAVEYVRGAGYATESEAIEAMNKKLPFAASQPIADDGRL